MVFDRTFSILKFSQDDYKWVRLKVYTKNKLVGLLNKSYNKV